MFDLWLVINRTFNKEQPVDIRSRSDRLMFLAVSVRFLPTVVEGVRGLYPCCADQLHFRQQRTQEKIPSREDSCFYVYFSLYSYSSHYRSSGEET